MARRRRYKIRGVPKKRRVVDDYQPPAALEQDEQEQAVNDYRPPAALRRIKRGLTAIVAFVAVVMSYAVYWMITAYLLNNKVNGWLADRRAEGYQLAFEDYQFGGFPMLFRMDFIKPSIAASLENPDWSWRGDHAIIESLPWRPWNLKVSAPGGHHLGVAGANGTADYAGSIGELRAEFPLDDKWPPQGKLTIRDLDLSAGLVLRASARSIVAGIENLGDSGASGRTPTARFTLDADEVAIPPLFPLPAGNFFRQISLEAWLLGHVAPELAPSSLAQWRDAGGSLEIRRFGIVYGPLNLLLGGAFAVDENIQLIGAFTAKAQGFFEIIDGLRKAGLVSGKDALNATLVLGAMARKPKTGGPMTLNLAIAIQNQKIYAGSVSLAEIPAIPWKENVSSGNGPKRE